MNKIICILVLMTALTGCKERSTPIEIVPVETVPIERQGVIHYDAMESEIVIYKGVLTEILFHRVHSHGDRVDIYQANSKIHSFTWDYGLASALIVDDKICLFGSSDWGGTNSVYKTCLDDDMNPISTIKLFDGWVFNTSVTWNGSFYIMAYETLYGRPFSIEFKKSYDLINWEDIGAVFKPHVYAAAPMIKYIDGTYYVFWLALETKFITRVASTVDFETFNDLPVALIAPIFEEGRNTSDASLVEYDGQVSINYGDGDQLTYANIRRAVFKGTMTDLISALKD